ncbi:hypothetical protein U3516DRAFT_756091 [Neocallimastix sp. 'constans']
MVDQTESEILHYDESVTKDTVKADIKAKYYLNNNISDDIKKNIGVQGQDGRHEISLR